MSQKGIVTGDGNTVKSESTPVSREVRLQNAIDRVAHLTAKRDAQSGVTNYATSVWHRLNYGIDAFVASLPALELAERRAYAEVQKAKETRSPDVFDLLDAHETAKAAYDAEVKRVMSEGATREARISGLRTARDAEKDTLKSLNDALRSAIKSMCELAGPVSETDAKSIDKATAKFADYCTKYGSPKPLPMPGEKVRKTLALHRQELAKVQAILESGKVETVTDGKSGFADIDDAQKEKFNERAAHLAYLINEIVRFDANVSDGDAGDGDGDASEGNDKTE